MDLGTPNLAGRLGSGKKKKSDEVRFHGNDLVAMLTRKFSHSQDIGARVNFSNTCRFVWLRSKKIILLRFLVAGQEIVVRNMTEN